jgi:hypothetical protein
VVGDLRKVPHLGRAMGWRMGQRAWQRMGQRMPTGGADEVDACDAADGVVELVEAL